MVPVPMFWAILVIVGSVLAGTLLAFVPSGRNTWLGPMRTFALMAALAVVVLHLLPEALARVGAAAILVFIAGLLLPEMLGKLGVFLWRAGKSEPSEDEPEKRRAFALEASYFGLLLHRVGDGIGIGAYTGELLTSPGGGSVLTALAAHAVPVVAIVVLTFDSVRGRGSAIKRAVGLALASFVGVLLANAIPTAVFVQASAWLAAFVGGMLIHVVTHDLGVQAPKTSPQKLLDMLAAGLGIYVSFLGRGAHHEHHDGGPLGHFEHALLDFSIETGPLLILGLAIGALLTTFGTKIPARFFQSQGAVMDAARGTIIGAPLPLCSCSVLPISAAMKRRGAAPALVVAFLLSTPELGVETFALSVRFLGWEFAWLRLAGALLIAFGAALTVAVVLRREPVRTEHPQDLSAEVPVGPWHRRVVVAFDELLQHVGAWMILGVVAAALLEVGLPQEVFHSVSSGLAQFAVITLVAVPSYVCAPSATPLAAVLLTKGMSPGAVFVGLLLGPATNVATMVFLRRWFGGKAAAWGILCVIGLAWAFGFAIDAFLDPTIVPDVDHVGHEHSSWYKWLAAVSGLILVRAVFKSGVRGFLSTLGGEHGHTHGSDPGHGSGPSGHGHAH